MTVTEEIGALFERNKQLETKLLVTRATLKAILTALERNPPMMPKACALIKDTMAETVP